MWKGQGSLEPWRDRKVQKRLEDGTGQESLDGQGEHSRAWTEDRELTGGTGGTGRGQENLEGGTRGLTGALRGGGGA